MSGERELRVIEGWLTDDPRQFELYTRKRMAWSVFDQLAVDARSWKVWMFWAGSLGCLTLALVSRSVSFGVAGALAGLAYLFMLHTVLSGFRRVQLIEVTVHAFDQRVDGTHLVTGAFEHPQTGAVGQALCGDWAIEKVRRLDGSVDALVAYDATVEASSSLVFVHPASSARRRACRAARSQRLRSRRDACAMHKTLPRVPARDVAGSTAPHASGAGWASRTAPGAVCSFGRPRDRLPSSPWPSASPFRS